MHLSFTVGQYIYFHQPAMATTDTERLSAESYNKLMHTKPGPFKVIEVSQTTITIDEDGIQNTICIHGAPLAPSAKFAEQRLVSTQVGAVDKRVDIVDEG